MGIEPTIRIFKQIPSSLSGARTLLSEPPGHSTLVVSFSQSYSSLLPVPEVTNHLVNGLKIEKFLVFFSASEIEINWVCLSFKTFLLANLHQLKLMAMWESLLRSLLLYGLEGTIRKSEISLRKN